MLRPETHRFTFAIIGDTHVKPETGDQSAPWKVNNLATARARWVAREIERYEPTFVVHLGDLVHPIPELSSFGEAVEMTRTLFASFHNRMHVIPGNHDIGDKPNRAMPAKMVRDDWIALHEKSFGPSFFSFDHDEMCFIFLNNPVFNSGSPIETRQRTWLAETLAGAAGRRIFLFMHYPLFLLDPVEPGNYDNIDEPARSDILGLIRNAGAEAVFAGHVHNLFYHRLDGTEFYVMPATSFVRQDYAELFRVAAAAENGRNDAEKLGFALVEVHADGHVVHWVRSYGEELGADHVGPPPAVRSPSRQLVHPKKAGGAPFGMFLRHPWAEITALPHNGPMDEFLRKEARNDYTVAALWRLGIRALRVPLGDLLEARTRARMADLVAIGHRFTVFGFGVPAGADAEIVIRHADLVERYECVLPDEWLATEASSLAAFRAKLGRPVLLSRLASSASTKKFGSRTELFVSHGFQPDQLGAVEALLAATEAGAIDHVVVRTDLEAGHIAETAAMLSAWQEAQGCRVDMHLRIAANNPAANVVDDAAILAGVVELYAAALAHPELAVFADTFMDLDRGYFVRHGLVDRRCNLRSAGLAIEALNACLGDVAGPVALSTLDAPDGRVLTLRGDRRSALILLPRAGGEMRVAAPAGFDTAAAVTLDEPWMIQPQWGTDLVGGPPPSRVSHPTLLIQTRS